MIQKKSYFKIWMHRVQDKVRIYSIVKSSQLSTASSLSLALNEGKCVCLCSWSLPSRLLDSLRLSQPLGLQWPPLPTGRTHWTELDLGEVQRHEVTLPRLPVNSLTDKSNANTSYYITVMNNTSTKLVSKSAHIGHFSQLDQGRDVTLIHYSK